MRTAVLIALSSGLAASPLIWGCATRPDPRPIHFYVSWPGGDAIVGALAGALDGRMRTEPGFVRNTDDPIDVYVEDAVAAPGGVYRFRVRIDVVSRVYGRLIPRSERSLADFAVSCAATDLQPCVEAIVARVRQQPPKIWSLYAHAKGG